MSLKKRAKKLLGRRAAIAIANVASFPLRMALRRRLRDRIGMRDWKRISRMQAVSWPDDLSRPASLLDTNYYLPKILIALGIKRLSPTDGFDPERAIFIRFEDTTNAVRGEEEFKALEAVANHAGDLSGLTMINNGCRDISKRNVAKVFEDVFGYPLDVDPTTHEGEMVEKSDTNAQHDGRVITGPIAPGEVREDCVYSVLVDTRVDEGSVQDFRLMYIGELADFCFRERRRIEIRFSTTNIKTDVVQTSEHFSDEEIRLIETFCGRMGLDVGELDCLRDRNSGRIYIVDVANTPGSNKGLPLDGQIASLERAALYFAKNICGAEISI
ncbi:hypothetical protein [Sphingomicrobium sediminis]|uniref:ATP-grasp domain-containing protein n=1 Tax=Sphingomicrobium sediminis TaxID=2950949 RepID=A0A9X2J1T8_9SPHN|nr:hypothetical protein [Sphingomicrobium sediminis]MCM8557603.1 hypothetical protein [Sphingomicrobium sediminis]